MGVDGSDRVRLTTLSGGDPAWSPDGARIAFTSTRDGPGEEVYVMDADGSHQTRLTTSTTKRDRWPSWAPDSARIVFASDYHSSLYELYRINVATRQVTRLTSNSAEETEPSWRVLPQVPVAGLYKPVSPVRVIDSRPGSQVGPFATPWGPGEARTVTVVGVGGVTADAEAVVVNVAGVLPTEATHLTLWPAGAGKPKVSNLNLGPGEVAANLATVRLESGAIEIANHRGSIHVVVDVVGFYGPRPTGSRFHPLSQPVRVLDSRPGSGIGPYDSPWGPKQARTLAVAGITVTPEGSTPVTIPPGASAVALNVTGVFPTEATHLTVWPTGRLMPKASSLNLPAGDVRPNLVITKVGDDGQISIFNNAGAQHVVADLVGYYVMPVDQQSDPSGLRFQAVDPVRVLDSRPASHVGPYSTPWGPTVTRPVPTGLPGSVAVLNVTGVFPTEATHLTVWPDAQATRPRTSNLNLPPGSVRPNLVITAMAGGQVQISNQSGEIHVLADVAGYFVP